MNDRYYIADEDGNEFRIFNCKELVDEFLKLRPECKLSRSEVQLPLNLDDFTAKHGEALF